MRQLNGTSEPDPNLTTDVRQRLRKAFLLRADSTTATFVSSLSKESLRISSANELWEAVTTSGRPTTGAEQRLQLRHGSVQIFRRVVDLFD
jgi:hypothetical protein